jgi:hypothetical protein
LCRAAKPHRCGGRCKGAAWFLLFILYRMICRNRDNRCGEQKRGPQVTGMPELQKRKQALNLAVVYVDPDAFSANLMGWLEITAFITAQRAGLAPVAADGLTPALTTEDLQRPDVQNVGNDALFAFCMTAALKGDRAAVDQVEAALVAAMGPEFPGWFGLNYFRGVIDNPETLEDFVGHAGRKLLLGDVPPPPLRAK